MPKFVLLAVLLGAVVQMAPATAATFKFIRHAESKTNAGTASPDELADPPLTDLGTQQALDLVDRLRSVDLTDIYVSSYKRTSLTIAPTAAAFDLMPTVVPETREWSFGDEPGLFELSQLQNLFRAWASGDTAAKIEGRPTSESLDELVARVVPAYAEIVDRHEDEDGVVAIVGHGGSIGWTLPFFAQNVTLPFALANGLRNTAVVDLALDAQGRPLVTNWDGIAFDANGPVAVPSPVPLPASGLMLLAAAGGLFVRGTRRREAPLSGTRRDQLV